MTPCKVCGAAAAPFGEADANRSCEDRDGFAPFPPTGRAIRYEECTACGFVFTTAFDALSDAELGAAIYNADYAKADPEFAEVRPRYLAGAIATALAPFPGLALLDYGGGAGRMAALLREAGFAATCYDPYFDTGSRPEGQRFPLVTAFEVLEHSRDPLATLRDALRFAEPDAALLCSTGLRPAGAGMEWGYIAPRNGHVSLHTAASLDRAAKAVGRRRLTWANSSHLLVPPSANLVARHLVTQGAGEMLYAASRAGIPAYVDTWTRLARTDPAGAWRRLLDPRHPLRALVQGVMSESRRKRRGTP